MRAQTSRPPAGMGTERPGSPHQHLIQGESTLTNWLRNGCPKQMKPQKLAANEMTSRLSSDTGAGDPRPGNGCSRPPASWDPRRSRPLLAEGRHQGGTTQPRQISGTGRNVPNCWAGQGGGRGSAGRRGHVACIPAAGRWGARSGSGYGGSGAVMRREDARGQVFRAARDQGDVCCPRCWLGTPGLLERPKAATFTPPAHRCCFSLAFQVTEPHFGLPPSCVPLHPGGSPAPPYCLGAPRSHGDGPKKRVQNK